MNCPYCKRTIGLPLDTGFIEAQKFTKHLRKCRKNPSRQSQTLLDALKIRAESGQ